MVFTMVIESGNILRIIIRKLRHTGMGTWYMGISPIERFLLALPLDVIFSSFVRLDENILVTKNYDAAT